MKSLFSIKSIACYCWLVISSGCLNAPDMKAINKDLGIRIPKKYQMLQNESDAFGLGADAENVYAFKFDSIGYTALTQSIERSILFNFASEKEFDSLSSGKKIAAIKRLVENEMTSYWIRSDTDYIFDGNALIINEPGKAFRDAADEGYYLPNLDTVARFSNGTPVSVYEVKARVDRKKHILYYKYVHI